MTIFQRIKLALAVLFASEPDDIDAIIDGPADDDEQELPRPWFANSVNRCPPRKPHPALDKSRKRQTELADLLMPAERKYQIKRGNE